MTDKHYGPTLPVSQEVHQLKYRSEGETFKESMVRVAHALKDNEEHYKHFKDCLLNQRFMPAGRVQAAMGAPRTVTPYNCFVSGKIQDDMNNIMSKASEAATTMRLGGGIGYDFSTLRPRGANISSLDSRSSGPVSFMGIYDAVCKTIASAGTRRGAQMGVLRVDHPDIEEFITAKHSEDKLTQFNVSIAITDKFMEAVEHGRPFDLVFEGRVYKTIDARSLWEKIMRSTWDWAEPGVLFIDRINEKNNLWYCENISATNPCAEQPLPPYGACLLGSFNLTKYVWKYEDHYYFDWNSFKHDIPVVVRAMDNVVDRAKYPLETQRYEAQSKRRMGLGITGLANAVEAVTGAQYGSEPFLAMMEDILRVLRDTAYRSSIALAVEKGPFEKYAHAYLESGFAKTLPKDIRDDISKYGIRNSHLLSIAPTGTISLSADNVSSGIEPVFSVRYTRTINTNDGPKHEDVTDYGHRVFNVVPLTADKVSASTHVDVLNLASKFVDSACSKTCNIGDSVTWEEFKDVYMQAYKGGSSGCTTYRAAGKRYGILNANSDEETVEKPVEEETNDYVDEGGGSFVRTTTTEPTEESGGACFIDPVTGQKECG